MDYQQYYTNQAGSGYPVFHGTRFQRGYGLGNIFRGLIRWITPIIKTHALPEIAAGSKEIGREAIKNFQMLLMIRLTIGNLIKLSKKEVLRL